MNVAFAFSLIFPDVFLCKLTSRLNRKWKPIDRTFTPFLSRNFSVQPVFVLQQTGAEIDLPNSFRYTKTGHPNGQDTNVLVPGEVHPVANRLQIPTLANQFPFSMPLNCLFHFGMAASCLNPKPVLL